MRFSAITVVFASFVASAVAQTGCQAEYVVQQCIADTMPMLEACKANDWECMCDKSNNVLICYNNCPGDDARAGALQQNEYYCNAAKAANPSSSTLTALPSTTPVSSTAGSLSSLSSGVTSSGSSVASITPTRAAATSSASASSTGTGGNFVSNQVSSAGAGPFAAVDAMGLVGLLAWAFL